MEFPEVPMQFHGMPQCVHPYERHNAAAALQQFISMVAQRFSDSRALLYRRLKQRTSHFVHCESAAKFSHGKAAVNQRLKAAMRLRYKH